MHAAGYTQRGQPSRQNGDDELDDVLDDFFFHIFERLLVMGYRLLKRDVSQISQIPQIERGVF